MRAPWWRKQTKHWYIKIAGEQVRLSDEPDPDGGRRKKPPPVVEKRWHELDRAGGRPKDMTAKALFDLFRPLCDHEPKQSTRWCLNRFEAFVGPTRKVSTLIPADLTAFFKKNPQWGPSSQRTITNRVLAAINYGVREGLLDRNPISSTPGYRRHGYHTKRLGTVDPELGRQLEAAAIPALRAILVALRETGCRPSELRRAQLEKCDLVAGVLLVPNKTARSTGKDERAIYLSEEAKALVRGLIGDRTAGYVFLTQSGKPWTYTNLVERWQHLVTKVPVPKGVTLYTYRRTFISAAINDRNVNPALVAQLVGHVGLDMILKHYLQEDPDALRKAVAAITAGKGNPPTGPG